MEDTLLAQQIAKAYYEGYKKMPPNVQEEFRQLVETGSQMVDKEIKVRLLPSQLSKKL
jgi:AAA+ superfamily predicted ATPase